MLVTEAVKVVVPHVYDDKEPQVPVNIWILVPDVVKSVPTELKLTVILVSKVEVVNLYHTSSSGVPVAHPTEMPELAVAPQTVPELFVVPLLSIVAPLQSSFDGGAG